MGIAAKQAREPMAGRTELNLVGTVLHPDRRQHGMLF